MDTKNENILITTAISYTNGSPHIGHLYEAILGDFVKRVYKISNYNVKLLTGTDEHGKKIQITAQENGIEPIELCNKYSNEFIEMNKKICSSFDYFIRTTDTTHKELVLNSIKNITSTQTKENTIIYSGEYSGYYNIREECYITEQIASQTNYIDPITSKPYEIVKEPTYYFVLNKFIEQIEKTIKNVSPKYFQDEINTRISKGLDDLSITRTTFTWGINFLDDHIIYVWFDALLNYVTGKNILFPNDDKIKTIHLIGKDILWFHSVIYPAILEACGYSKYQPYKILTHGFILDKDGRKMSKSLGNVISNEDLIKKYPIDAIRYYLITKTTLGHDFKFDADNLINTYNNILIKSFGNLFQRLLKIVKPIQNEINDWLNVNKNLIDIKQNECFEMIKQFVSWNDNFNIYNDYLNNLIDLLNKDLTEKKPWTLAMNEKVNILSEIIINYHLVMCLMYPIIPSKVIELSNYFGWTNKLNITTKEIYLDILDANKIIAFNYIK